MATTPGPSSPPRAAASPKASPGPASPGPATPGAATPGPSSPPPTGSPTRAQDPASVGILEADDDNAVADDAACEFDDTSDTTSIRSIVLRHRHQNGRTYHAYQQGGEFNTYWLPNDEEENERLDLQHNLFVMTQGYKLFTCPHVRDKKLRRVLDAGCGTGIWSMEFGDEFPDTAVVGVDLSSIQPSMVAPNVEFFVDDLEQDWTFVQKFDFIYARMLTGSIKDWPRFFQQSYENLHPGGYIEVADIVAPLICNDGSMPEDSAVQRWSKLILEATEKIGSPLNSGLKYKQQLIDAGFQDVHEVVYKWPLNAWPKDKDYKRIGHWSMMNTLEGVGALCLMLFTTVLGWTREEVEMFLIDVRKDLKNLKYHAYSPIYVVYGQKPE